MPANRPEYDRAYWLQHGHRRTLKVRLREHLEKALECLTEEFNSGPSGQRAQAIAQVRQALLLLGKNSPAS